MSLSDKMLPGEIFIEIATKSASSWHSMLAIPSFGRFTLTPYGKQLAFKVFGRIDNDIKTTIYYMNNKIHRNDGPAIIHKDGSKLWFINGKLHREDGPAIIDKDGTQKWYINNKRHRKDGPAMIFANGTQRWYFNDKLHRTYGPAVIDANGSQHWYINGKKTKEASKLWNKRYYW